MTPIFVSYYTSAYRPDALQLIASLDAFGLPHDVRALGSLGSWEVNCGRKPVFVREMLDAHPGSSIVWLDADARVKAPPYLFRGLNRDFAAHWKDGQELLSGTLFFANTLAGRALADRWIVEQRHTPDEWDQHTLALALRSMPWIRTAELPAAYTQIFDSMAHHGQPVIEHMQASRRLRQEIQL